MIKLARHLSATRRLHFSQHRMFSSELARQFRLIPVQDHPIYPGSSSSWFLDKEQYELLKSEPHPNEQFEGHIDVFASVVSNDSLLLENNPEQLEKMMQA